MPSLFWIKAQRPNGACGATVRGTYGTPEAGTLLPCASGTYNTQEAGTRSPYVQYGGPGTYV